MKKFLLILMITVLSMMLMGQQEAPKTGEATNVYILQTDELQPGDTVAAYYSDGINNYLVRKTPYNSRFISLAVWNSLAEPHNGVPSGQDFALAVKRDGVWNVLKPAKYRSYNYPDLDTLTAVGIGAIIIYNPQLTGERAELKPVPWWNWYYSQCPEAITEDIIFKDAAAGVLVELPNTRVKYAKDYNIVSTGLGKIVYKNNRYYYKLTPDDIESQAIGFKLVAVPFDYCNGGVYEFPFTLLIESSTTGSEPGMTKADWSQLMSKAAAKFTDNKVTITAPTGKQFPNIRAELRTSRSLTPVKLQSVQTFNAGTKEFSFDFSGAKQVQVKIYAVDYGFTWSFYKQF